MNQDKKTARLEQQVAKLSKANKQIKSDVRKANKEIEINEPRMVKSHDVKLDKGSL